MTRYDLDLVVESLKLYGRLQSSLSDIAHASYCAEVLLKARLAMDAPRHNTFATKGVHNVAGRSATSCES